MCGWSVKHRGAGLNLVSVGFCMFERGIGEESIYWDTTKAQTFCIVKNDFVAATKPVLCRDGHAMSYRTGIPREGWIYDS